MQATKSIYIIDDDTALRTAYAAELVKLGYQVEEAGDGVQGLELLSKGKPHLIVLDMLMPNMDGMTFLRQLRADKANADIMVVVTSSFESTEDAEALGVTRHLSKMQFMPDEVAAAIDALLKEQK